MKDDTFFQLFNRHESELTDDGGSWKIFPRSCSGVDRRIRNLIRVMQPKKLLFNRLIPVSEDAARVNTLSSRYGLGRFPLHSDFATTAEPPKYILLAASRPRDTETLLFDARRLIVHYGLDYLLRGLFILHGKTPHYCRMLTLKDGRLCFRYNKAVMTPQNSEAHEIANYLDGEGLPMSKINWHENRVALIDNWTTFHSRSSCDSTNKIGLYRFAIWGED